MADAKQVANEETDSDYLFDAIDQYMKSPTWDNEVMGFIDDHCVIFDSEEENKFEHSAIHQQFQELVDSLLTNHLSHMEVTPEAFAEACEKARFANVHNKQVFEHLLAMEDFLTFKKMMVKRNMELELEAVQAMQASHVPIVGPQDDEEAERQFQMALKESAEMSVAEAQEVLDASRADAASGKEGDVGDGGDGGGAALDAEIRRAMDENLMEIEVLNRQFEIEQRELEQALAMSLKVDEERIKLALAQERFEEELMLHEDAADDDVDELGTMGGTMGTLGVSDDDDDPLASSDDEPIRPSATLRGGRTPQQQLRAEAKEAANGATPQQPLVASSKGEPMSAVSASPMSAAADAKESPLRVASSSSSSSSSPHRSPAAVAASPGEAKGGPLGGGGGGGDDFGGAEEFRVAGTGILADALTSVGPGLSSPAPRMSPAAASPSPVAAAASSSSSSPMGAKESAPFMSSSGGRAAAAAAAAEENGEYEEYAQQQQQQQALEERKKKKKKKRERRERRERENNAEGGGGGLAGPSSLGAGLAPLGGPGMGKGLAPLPSIGDLQKQMNKRRQEAEEAFKRNQDSLAQQKSKEAELAKAAGVTEEDAVRRAEYLKAQRDKIIAKKRAEREAKAKAYDAQKGGAADVGRAMPEGLTLSGGGGGGGSGEGKDGEDDDAEELRRKEMSAALARRMKQDLLVSEEARLQKIQEEQYSELDRQLRLVETLREENRQKEEQLGDAIRMQQVQRFRNLKESVARDTAHG